jgi:hypothetical protein
VQVPSSTLENPDPQALRGGNDVNPPSERRIPVVLGLVFFPWIAVVLFTAGGWAALNFLVYAIVVFTVGYGPISLVLPAQNRVQALFLAPALGVLAISAFSAFWVRGGLPLFWVPALWLALSALGAVGLWRDRAVWTRSTVTHGLTLALFSLLICVVYFLPSASHDLVQRRDGSFHWRNWETQHFHSIAASIKNSGSPPKSPGTDTAELLYHFGPLAPAAAISRVDGLDLGDAVARVTRGASLWALVLSCFSVGTLLSLKATGKKFGGIMSVAGLFFYGSLLATFDDALVNSRHHLLADLLLKRSDGGMFVDGGAFDHFLSGHSLLHGVGAITAIMGICLVARERESALTWRGAILLLLPALAVPVNSVAALYCFGIVVMLLFWGRLRARWSWISIVLTCCFFVAAWKMMGYGHAPDATATMLKEHIAWQWWTLVMWLVAVLGFRILGLRWIEQPWKVPVAALVLATVVGLLFFSLALHLRDNNEHYGFYFLQSLFSIFAFSRMTSGSWYGDERVRLVEDWLGIAIKTMILLCACAFLIGIAAFAIHRETGIQDFRIKVFFAVSMMGLLFGLLALMKRSSRFASIGSAVLMCVLMIGFLAWAPIWFGSTVGALKADITYPPGVVHGLRRLGELMARDERFATNKHSLEGDSLQPPSEHSYGYSALSERPVLLEGYLARGERFLPWFSAMLHDNDLLFTTTDPQTLRNIAETWHVRWLVARPGTDIALPRPLPSWLVEQQDCGDLKIYRIDSLDHPPLAQKVLDKTIASPTRSPS